jgi:hypothetical protein
VLRLLPVFQGAHLVLEYWGELNGEAPLRIWLCASSKPQDCGGNKVCAENPNPSYSLFFFLVLLSMVASFGSSN